LLIHEKGGLFFLSSILIYDFSSAMFVSDNGKNRKCISVAFTNLKTANNPKFKASE